MLSLNPLFNELKVENLQKKLSESSEILIYSDGVDESLAYNIINVFSDYSRQLDFDKHVRLAQPHDFKNRFFRRNVYWIILNNGSLSGSFENIDQNCFSLFDFSKWTPSDEVKTFFGFDHFGGSAYKKAVWSSIISICLLKEIFSESDVS